MERIEPSITGRIGQGYYSVGLDRFSDHDEDARPIDSMVSASEVQLLIPNAPVDLGDLMVACRPHLSRRRHFASLVTVLVVVGVQNGCGGVGYLGTTASSFLRHARESDDPNVRYAAINRLANPAVYTSKTQKREVAEYLAAALTDPNESPATKATICRTLGLIGLPESATPLRSAALESDPLVRVQACRALGLIGDPQDATLLARIMATDIDRGCRIAAIEALESIRPTDPRIAVALVSAMKNPDPAVRTAAYQCLITLNNGEDLGPNVEPWQRLANSRLENNL